MGGGNEYVHYFNGGDVSQMNTYVKMYQIIHLKYVHFTEAQLYFNSVLKFRKRHKESSKVDGKLTKKKA